jgi:gliding motility-associated-like protein
MLNFTSISLTPGASGIEDPMCGVFSGDDNWFSFQVPPSGAVAIELEAGSVGDAGFALYSGACGTPDLVNCVPNYLCGEDPMPKFFYENLIPGATYYLRVWSMDGTFGSVQIRISDPYGSNYVLSGSASPVSFAGSANCIRLTNSSTNQLGCAWFPVEANFSEPFTYEYSLYFGTNDANGADGMCIVFQNNGIPTCGTAGMGIGALGIPNSLIIEFDTWQNPELGDPVQDHVGISSNGAMNHNLHPPVPVANIEDGGFHDISISWDPGSTSLDVFLDGVNVASITYDVVGIIFGGNPLAHWGVTSSTGAAINEHILCFESVTLENASPIFTNQVVEICFGEEVFLEGDWQTEPGVYVDYYLAAGGCDSIVTTNLVLLSGPTVELDTTICPGESLVLGNNIYTTSGTYEWMLQTVRGCDSLVIIHLQILEFSIDLISEGPFLCNEFEKELVVLVDPPDNSILYQWSTNNGSIIGSFSDFSVTIGQPGNYQASVIYEGEGFTCDLGLYEFDIDIDQNLPIIDIVQVGEFSCNQLLIQLDASGSVGGDQFVWLALSGAPIISGEQSPIITIGGPGVYILELVNSQNNCVVTQTIIVGGDPPPNNLLVIEIPEILTCDRDTVWLNAGSSLLDAGFTASWVNSNGSVVSGNAIGEPLPVTTPGWYALVIVDAQGFCSDTTFVEVLQDLSALDISIIDIDTIFCNPSAGGVTISISTNEPTSILWESRFGAVFGVSNGGLSLQTSDPDSFQVTIRNPQTGCLSRLWIEIPEDKNLPELLIEQLNTLNCYEPIVQLTGTVQATGSYTFDWNTINGNIISGNNSNHIFVDIPGLYYWYVTNSVNGCESIDSIIIQEGRIYPEISANLPEVITCINEFISIEITTSITEPDYQFIWRFLSGGFDIPLDTSAIVATSSGVYSVVVLNAESGCMDSLTIEVLEDRISPIAEAGLGFTLDCLNNEFELDGSASSSGSNYIYNWTTSGMGNILNGNSVYPTIFEAGWYYLEVTSIINGCSAMDSVLVINDANAPEIFFEPIEILDCNRREVWIDASASSQGNQFQVFWSTPNGSFVLIEDRYRALVNEPGIYELEILNTSNQCRMLRQIEVSQDTISPYIEIEAPHLIDCNNDQVTPLVFNTVQGSQYSYSWTSITGGGVTNDNRLEAIFVMPGIYRLLVTNTNNGCLSTADLEIQIDTLTPLITLQVLDTLTCALDFVQVNSIGSSSGDPYRYTWSSSGQNFSEQDNGQSIHVIQGGIYVLTILNTDNGCEITDSINVIEVRDLPLIHIVSPDTLTCNVDQVQISGIGSATGNFIRYEWSSEGGSIISEHTALTALVASTGWYRLQVEDIATGCISLDSVRVVGDFVPPMIEAGSDRQLTCDSSQFILFGFAVNNLRPVNFSWATQDGNIVEILSGNSIRVNAAGHYYLIGVDLYNGCSSVDSLFVRPNLDGILGADVDGLYPDCNRDFAYIEVSNIRGGQRPFSFELIGWQELSEISIFRDVPPGTYELIVYDANGCTWQETISFEDIEPVSIELPPLYLVELGQGTFLEPTFSEVFNPDWQLIWTPGIYLDCTDCERPYSSPLHNQRYTLRLLDHNGCRTEASTLVQVRTDNSVYVPNAFTPGNGDGINDFFTIYSKNQSISEVVFLEIFDRWGNKVFYKDHFSADINEEGWDGTFRGQALNPAVFVYRAEVLMINGNRANLHGEVTLYR